MLWQRQKRSVAIDGSRPRPAPDLPAVSLEGTRITMRPPSLTDWREWSDLRRKNQAYLKPFEPGWAEDCFTKEFYLRRMKRQIIDWHRERSQPFLIFKKSGKSGESPCLIGGMNINNICRGAAQYAALGYWIDEAHQGQGYMSEALRLTLCYAFDDLELHRVNASCLPENERSKKLLLKAGFAEEGFARRYLQIDGRWQDHTLFGITIEDFEGTRLRAPGRSRKHSRIKP